MNLFFHLENRNVRISNRMYLYAFIVLSTLLVGCSPTPTFIKSDFKSKQVQSIAIMPVIDKRSTVEDTQQSHKSLAKIDELLSVKLMDKNYDILPSESVQNTLKINELENMSPANLCSALKVDGIVFGELYDYSDVFFVNHTLKMRIKLFDAKGDSLWVNDLDDIDRPYLSAIAASLGWALGVVVHDKVAPKNKFATILAGIAAAEIVYLAVDALGDETSLSVGGVFKSLPAGNGSGKRLEK